MSLLDVKERAFLLGRARFAIMREMTPTLGEDRAAESVPDRIRVPRGCFVTLTLRGRLRGCIGTIEPILPLLDAIERNAKRAAFNDPRFSPVSASDVKQINIEISVLSPPRRLEFADSQELKQKLIPGKHGVIIQSAGRSAVFLPQVWKQLPDTEQFLKNLCLKCGLPENAWKSEGTEVSVYEAEYFSEIDS